MLPILVLLSCCPPATVARRQVTARIDSDKYESDEKTNDNVHWTSANSISMVSNP